MYACSFELNNQPLSEFKIGTQSFPAFSGLGPYVNKRMAACTHDLGPIPPGAYYILDRRSGGFLDPLWDRIKGHSGWLALYADDGKIDDYTYCRQVERGNFRLHPKVGLGISKGCITVESQANFNHIHAVLTSVKPIQVPGTDIQAYGKVIVR